MRGPANIRPSAGIILAVAALAVGWITWRFLGRPAWAGARPSLIQLLAWMFWTATLAVTLIWVCWVRTEKGWRWRWRR